VRPAVDRRRRVLQPLGPARREPGRHGVSLSPGWPSVGAAALGGLARLVPLVPLTRLVPLVPLTRLVPLVPLTRLAALTTLAALAA
jgi:hypothetical protein